MESFLLSSTNTLRSSPWTVAFVFLFTLVVIKYIYRVTFHPLARYVCRVSGSTRNLADEIIIRFPGPAWGALSSIYAMSFDLPKKTSYIKKFPAWHDKYGPIIRIMPNHLHIRDVSAYNQVYKVASEYNKDITVRISLSSFWRAR